jgi:hypothetical protein
MAPYLIITVAPPIVREENEGLGEKQEDGGDEVLLNVIRPDYERLLPPPPMQPLYPLGEDGKVQGTPFLKLLMNESKLINQPVQCNLYSF